MGCHFGRQRHLTRLFPGNGRVVLGPFGWGCLLRAASIRYLPCGWSPASSLLIARHLLLHRKVCYRFLLRLCLLYPLFFHSRSFEAGSVGKECVSTGRFSG